MSKRQEIREKRRRERIRNQILVVFFVVAGALLVVFALVFNSPVDGTSIGDPNAPVRLDIWEDFQCPACANFETSVLPQILTTYVDTGDVYFTFHNYPFIDGGDPKGESHQAANAVMCALEQNRFWDYHDMLFTNWNGENKGAFVDERLVRFAEVLGLDMDGFNSCFEVNRYKPEIDQDYAAGQAAGARGTPYILVNGIRVINAQGETYVPAYEDVSGAIRNALAGQ
jgi:protein-disulfide isomerase